MDSSKAAENRRARAERKAAWLREMFDRHVSRWQEIAAGGATAAVAREVHVAVDEVLRRDRERDQISDRIRCHRGCSSCCHGPVEIWPPEAALLLEAARAAGVEIDRDRLERQQRHGADDWHAQPREDAACVFLGADGACQVYEARPSACRKLQVLSEPQLCEARVYPSEAVERWMSWEAEVMEAAALEVFGRGLMPRMLGAALDGKAPQSESG